MWSQAGAGPGATRVVTGRGGSRGHMCGHRQGRVQGPHVWSQAGAGPGATCVVIGRGGSRGPCVVQVRVDPGVWWDPHPLGLRRE